MNKYIYICKECKVLNDLYDCEESDDEYTDTQDKISLYDGFKFKPEQKKDAIVFWIENENLFPKLNEQNRVQAC